MNDVITSLLSTSTHIKISYKSIANYRNTEAVHRPKQRHIQCQCIKFHKIWSCLYLMHNQHRFRSNFHTANKAHLLLNKEHDLPRL